MTVDGDTLKDGTVTIRDRDIGEQKRFDSKKLETVLRELLNGTREIGGVKIA